MRRSSEPATPPQNYTVRTSMPEMEDGHARKRILMRRSSEPAILGEKLPKNYAVRTWMSEIEVGQGIPTHTRTSNWVEYDDARKRKIMSSKPAITVRTWMTEMEVGQGDANDSDFPALPRPIRPYQDNTMRGRATANPWFRWLFAASENDDANAGSKSLSVESWLSDGKHAEVCALLNSYENPIFILIHARMVPNFSC